MSRDDLMGKVHLHGSLSYSSYHWQHHNHNHNPHHDHHHHAHCAMRRHKSGSDQASQLPQPLAPSLLSHSLARLLLIVIVIVFISSSLSLSSLSSLQGISDDGFVTNLPQGGFPCFQSKHLKARSGPGYLTVSAHKGFLLFSCFWTLSVVIDTPCCRPGPSDTMFTSCRWRWLPWSRLPPAAAWLSSTWIPAATWLPCPARSFSSFKICRFYWYINFQVTLASLELSLASLELTLVNLVPTLLLVNLVTQPLGQATLDIHLSRDSCEPFPSHQVELSC